jgi:hypothetical protein
MKGVKDRKTGKFIKNIEAFRECPVCITNFSPRLNKQKFCSRICFAKFYTKNKLRNCIVCKKEFYAERMKTKFCSSICYGKTLMKVKPLKQKYQKKFVIKICEECGFEFIVNPARKNRARFCDRVCKGRFFRGEKSCHYKHNREELVTSNREDGSYRYREWSLSIKKRDCWTCRINNSDCRGRLESHHILSWKNYPELRYDINNGITLCLAHHPRKRAEEKRLATYFAELVSVLK